jgi:hypothetical protein
MHLPLTFTFCTGLPVTEEEELSEPEEAGCEPEDSAPALDVGSSAPEESSVAEELSSPPVTGAVDDDSSSQAISMSDRAALQRSIFFIKFSFLNFFLTLLNINLNFSKVNSFMQQNLNFLKIFSSFCNFYHKFNPYATPCSIYEKRFAMPEQAGHLPPPL